MARPLKQGLDYFPFDVGFFENEKIEAIGGEFGIKGEITTIKLLCTIYKHGYYTEWSELNQMKILKQLPGVAPDLLDAVLKRLVKWGFFDETLFNSAAILTSRSIQERYFEATKRRYMEVNNLPYIMIDVAKIRVNVNNNSVNASNNTQKRGNKNKVKMSISPSVDDVKLFFKEKGYKEEIAIRAWEYYNAGDWVDSKGNQIKSWKQKMISVWFKDENKIPQHSTGLLTEERFYDE